MDNSVLSLTRQILGPIPGIGLLVTIKTTITKLSYNRIKKPYFISLLDFPRNIT